MKTKFEKLKKLTRMKLKENSVLYTISNKTNSNQKNID
jgi:hypothetical protein